MRGTRKQSINIKILKDKKEISSLMTKMILMKKISLTKKHKVKKINCNMIFMILPNLKRMKCISIKKKRAQTYLRSKINLKKVSLNDSLFLKKKSNEKRKIYLEIVRRNSKISNKSLNYHFRQKMKKRQLKEMKDKVLLNHKVITKEHNK